MLQWQYNHSYSNIQSHSDFPLHITILLPLILDPPVHEIDFFIMDLLWRNLFRFASSAKRVSKVPFRLNILVCKKDLRWLPTLFNKIKKYIV